MELATSKITDVFSDVAGSEVARRMLACNANGVLVELKTVKKRYLLASTRKR